MGFRMPTDRFRMARIHPGHNGPPLLHNVIPDLTLDRVNSLHFCVCSSKFTNCFKTFCNFVIRIKTNCLFCLFVCNRSSALLRLDELRTRKLGQSPPESASYSTMNSGCLSRFLHLIAERDISWLRILSFCQE